MTLFISLLPFYLLGNFHCLGMCGPLVFMLGTHRYRNAYFFGRLTSYALTGWVAGELGALLHLFLQQWHLAASMSYLFALLSFAIALQLLLGWRPIPTQFLFRYLAPMQRSFSLLLLRDGPWPAFLFGFFTVALPCGQTLLVFSACALNGVGWVGLLNGAAFALLTSPSLWVAMQAQGLFKGLRMYYNTVLGYCALLAGTLALLRGLAEENLIPHLVLSAQYHIVLY